MDFDARIAGDNGKYFPPAVAGIEFVISAAPSTTTITAVTSAGDPLSVAAEEDILRRVSLAVGLLMFSYDSTVALAGLTLSWHVNKAALAPLSCNWVLSGQLHEDNSVRVSLRPAPGFSATNPTGEELAARCHAVIYGMNTLGVSSVSGLVTA